MDVLNEVRAPEDIPEIPEDDAFYDDCLYLLHTRDSLFGALFKEVIKSKSNSGKLGASMANNWMGNLRTRAHFLKKGFHVTSPPMAYFLTHFLCLNRLLHQRRKFVRTTTSCWKSSPVMCG